MNKRLHFIVGKSVDSSGKKPKTLLKFDVKQKTLAKIALAILMISIVANLAYNMIFIDIKNQKAIEESRVGIETVLKSGEEVGQYDVKNNKPRKDFVNQDEVAAHIESTPKNDHLEIFDSYAFYLEQDLGDTGLKNVMDRLIAELQILGCKTFEEYLVKCGFVDFEGKADFKAYKSYMGATVVQFQEAQQMLADRGMGGISK